MHVADRAILRDRNFYTPLARLQDLTPWLLRALPDTIGGGAENLFATRAEIEDVVEFASEQVVYRDGRLVSRTGQREDAWAAAELYETR